MSFGRKMTPRGQMSGGNSLPAIMMMPPHIKATFMPDPPLKHLPLPSSRRIRRPKRYMDASLPPKRQKVENDDDDDDEEEEFRGFPKQRRGALTGVGQLMAQFERREPPERAVGPTPKSVKASRAKKRGALNAERLRPKVEEYRREQAESGGEYLGMNCYYTLFVGRLAYEVTERKLLREFEAFGPIKDLRLARESHNSASSNNNSEQGKSRGYAFIEYEREESMKRAFHAADGMRLENRSIVVDVERGHTVLNWLPRRLGGGLGGTRLGGKDKNITTPGRYDPSKPALPHSSSMHALPPTPSASSAGSRGAGGPDRGTPPPRYGGDRYGAGGGPEHGGYGRQGGRGRPPYGDRYGGGGPPPSRPPDGYYGGGGGRPSYGGDDRRNRRGRSRSRSPEMRGGRRGRY